MKELWSPFSNVCEDIMSCMKFDPTEYHAVVSASPCSGHFWKVWLGDYYYYFFVTSFPLEEC